MKMKTLFVLGKRWFDRVNGNTYHSAGLYINGEFYKKIDCKYGYGDHYLQSAKELLFEDKIIKASENSRYTFLYTYCNDKDIKFCYDVVDVQRKKDL